MCGYEEKETACAALTTPKIPLTAGGNWGGLEIKGGPYGGYVEWNEGMAFKNPVNASEDSCPILAATFGEPQSTTDEYDVLLQKVYRMSHKKLQKYWVRRLFSGEISAKPSYVPNAKAAGQEVMKSEGAISIVSAKEIPKDVKVLLIDGKKRGATPLTLELEIGDHKLELVSGEQSRAIPIKIAAKEEQQLLDDHFKK